MRLFPRRIAGQIAVLVVAAIAATHALVTTAFLVFNTAPPSPDRMPDAQAHRLVTLAAVFAAAPATDRPALLAAAERAEPSLHLRLRPGEASRPTQVGSPEHPAVSLLRRMLPAPLTVAQIGDAGPGPPPSSLRVAVALPGVEILEASLRGERPPRPPLITPLAITLLTLALSIALLSVWAARALAAPLDLLASAADSVGTPARFGPVPSRGPDEVLKVARALSHMRERVERLLEDRTQMLAAVSHDLRTPITRMRLRAEFLEPDIRRVTLRDLDQMNGMVEAALAFVRDGRRPGETVRVDLASLARTVCDMFADTGAVVAYEGPDRAVVEGRADELERALSNVVDNAVKYGGSAAIHVKAAPDGVSVTVADSGPGIPSDDLSAMMEPFVRGDRARNLDRPGGFGLGLPIARGIVAAHRGRLDVENDPAGGLIVRMQFPVPPRPQGREGGSPDRIGVTALA